jgi:phospholipase/carboxylesterase
MKAWGQTVSIGVRLLIVASALTTVACAKSNPDTRNSQPPVLHAAADDGHSGRLSARLIATPDESIGRGLHHLYLGVDTGRDGSIYVPQSYQPGHPAPLLVFFHGNRGDKTGSLDLLADEAERTGTILLLPESRLRTWDRIIGHAFGPDLLFVDAALKLVFKSLSIDAAHVAVGGFSDGASYSLSVGLTNGDLFTHVVAFSPGQSSPAQRTGQPRVFIMHGVEDDVLPIDECSREIVPALRKDGYDVTYEEFHGLHLVVDEEKTKMFDWFLGATP